MIQCRVCKLTKPEEAFSIDRRTVLGRQKRCKLCRSAHYQNNKRAARDYSYRRRYGITVEEYERRVEQQNGRCAMCAKPPKGKRWAGVLHVDHDHGSGDVRGLICQKCNTFLGMFEDAVLVANAIRYLAGGKDAPCE